jgi:sigma-B regulation protein RsbU (phosphoserine phosphatase)
MSRARQFLQRLGISGRVCLIGFAAALVLYLTGHGLLAFLDLLLLIPFAIRFAFRAARLLKQHSLWSLRNRLLLVYGLFGALPLLLILLFVGLGSWALMNELAIYLANSALQRHIDAVNAAVEVLHDTPNERRLSATPEIQKAFARTMPGIMFFLKDGTGEHHFPAEAPTLHIPPGWKSVKGVLVLNEHFYGWSHDIDPSCEITVIAPLTNAMIQNLVPNLGAIALVEVEKPAEVEDHRTPAAVGSLEVVRTKKSTQDMDFSLAFNEQNDKSGRPHMSRLPPPVSRLDIPVGIPATQQHYHLDAPDKTFPGVLWVYSRPSAVLRSFFSGSEVIRDVMVDALIAIAILFLLVELIAIWIGARLSRQVTSAINQLYEGTRRVIHGDFRHRIPVRAPDQLGELAQSFNQMTGNLERLLVIEKEKERLQTELEIAREVQGQLYPKEAPPICGLKLTVRCDPARMVSGDYYDYVEIARGKLAFAIGDVAGKGISAALLMATLQAALRAQISTYMPLRQNECADVPEVNAARLVTKLNRQIYAHTAPEKYATFFFALFDESTCTLTYTNAGHLSPLLFRNDEVIPLDSNGIVVGAFPFAKYDESCLIMNPGDLLLCYTDGITEPENAYGEEFGEKRLIDLVKKHITQDDHEIVKIVLDSVRSWTGTSELFDDMTLLLARQVQTV